MVWCPSGHFKTHRLQPSEWPDKRATKTVPQSFARERAALAVPAFGCLRFAMFSRAFSVLFTAALLTFTGCGKKDASATFPTPAGTAAAPRPQILRLGNGAEPKGIDPQDISGVTEGKIVMALFEGLLTPDPHDLHPLPGVAEAWEISPDGLTYTFHLRANAKWADGEPVTAQDFVESYRRMLSPKFASEYAYLLYNFVVGAKDYYDGRLADFSKVGFAAPDARTLRVTLLNSTPYLLNIIACHQAWDVVPLKVIERFGPPDSKNGAWTKPGNIVGNGPFILKEWLPKQKITVVRNPLYWDAANVKLDAIEFHAIDDATAEEQAFRTGRLDATDTMPLSKIDTYRRDHADTFRIEPYLGIYFYRCNVTKPPLTDKRVRRALALAIDRESIVKNITKGEQLPAYAVSYPGTAGYTPIARLSGDLAEAKRLLAEAGYPEGKGCPPIELLYNTSEAHKAIAEAIQQMWREKLGVEVRLTNQEWAAYQDTQHTHNYQMMRAGWIADYEDPHVFLEIWSSDNGNNDTLWVNADYDRLLQSALAAKTQDERYGIYQKMDAILVDECPVIPIYYYTHVHAISPKVKGWFPTRLDLHPYKYVWLEP